MAAVARTTVIKTVQLIFVVAIVTLLTTLIFAGVDAKPEDIYVPVDFSAQQQKCVTELNTALTAAGSKTTVAVGTGSVDETGLQVLADSENAAKAAKIALPSTCSEIATTAGKRSDIRKGLHLNDNVFVRWGKWAGGFVTGDFGDTYTAGGSRPVGPRLISGLWVSLLLMLYAQVFALAIAIPLGVVAAYKQGSWIDRVIGSSAFAAISLPGYALAMILAYYLGVKFGWFPPLGYTPIGENLGDHLRRMVIPAIALGLGPAAVYLRLLRSDMIATLQQDFIQMAKAKGVSSRRILWRHALRPSSMTLLTVAGLNIGTMIGSAVIVEFLFAIPGMGRQVGEAIFGRQYVQLQSLVAVLAFIFVLVNFIVDALYRILDPRIRNG